MNDFLNLQEERSPAKPDKKKEWSSDDGGARYKILFQFFFKF